MIPKNLRWESPDLKHFFHVLISMPFVICCASAERTSPSAFWKPLPEPSEADLASGAAVVTAEGVRSTRLAITMVAPIILLVACTVGLTVAAAPAFELVDRAAVQLMEPGGYIEAVLGGAP